MTAGTSVVKRAEIATIIFIFKDPDAKIRKAHLLSADNIF